MSALLRAADAIDALADALPEPHQRPWVAALGGDVLTEPDADDCNAIVAYATQPTGAHIAAVASPDRVRAVAALLRAIHHHDVDSDRDECLDAGECGDAIHRAAEHLARLYAGSDQ